jgi:hypothetical protein
MNTEVTKKSRIELLLGDINYLMIDDFQHNIFIRVNNQTTIELYNYHYELSEEIIKEFLKENYEANSVADAVERKEIIEFFVDQIKTFNKDLHTRQVVFQPKYEDKETLAACISCIQCIIRNGLIDIHIFVRSQNFETNFLYDNLTYCLIMLEIHKRIDNIEIGNIYVKVVSLHKVI